MKKILIPFFVLAFVLSACGGKTPVTETPVAVEATPVPLDAVIAEGHIFPARDATLSFQARGTVTEVRVKIGDRVKAGDVLARLGGPSDAAFAAAQLELVSAQQALKSFKETADIARAQALAALDKAEEARDKAQDYYDSLFEPYEYDKLVFQTVVTPLGPRRIPNIKRIKVKEADDETISDAETNLALTMALYDEALRAYERVKDGPDVDQLALLEARFNAASASVAAFAVIAPFDGVVMDVNVDAGQQAGPETWAVKVADTSAWYVETSDLTELEVVKVAIGQKAVIVADALPDASMPGTVDAISQAGVSQSGDVLYKVKVKVDEMDPRALWGMTVEVTFEPLQ